MTDLGTNRLGETGRNSATGTPLRVMTSVWPARTSRRMAPDSFLSCRWVIILFTLDV
jgi:hypothetical protein